MEQLKKQTLLILLFCMIGVGSTFAQKADLKKADALYRVKSYAEAIPLYEKGLTDGKSKSAQSKLAYCYKVLNKTKKATELYAKIITESRVRSDDYFYYGEVLMSQAKYEEAKVQFLKFQEMEPDEEKGMRMAKACDQIPFLTSIFPEATVMEFPHNTAYDDSSPVFHDNKMVFSSDRKTGVKLLKQKSGATGRDFIRLYSSELNEQKEWSAPKSFSGKLNEHNKNNANASFTPDGNEVFFTRNGNTSNRKNAFTLQLHSARKEKGKWKGIEILSMCRLAYNYMHPAISPDGKTLFFVSDKPGGKGGTDIFYSERKGDKWGKAINMDSTINTSSHEGFPFMNEDGKLYFCSKGHIGYGGFDIFVTEKLDDGTWAQPKNIGKPINSAMDDISISLNKENTRGAFTSSRKEGNDDIYLFALDGSIPASNEITMTTEIKEVSEITEPLTEVSNATQTTIISEEQPIAETKEMGHIPEMETTPIETAITEVVKVNSPEINTPEVIEKKELPTIATTSTVEPNVPIIEDTTPSETTAVSSPGISSSSNIPTMETTPIIEEIVSPEKELIAPQEQKTTIDEALEVQKINKETTTEATHSVIENGANSTMEISEIKKEVAPETIETIASSAEVMSPKAFQKAVNKGKQKAGMYYTLEDMNYQPGEYLLVPKMTLKLEPIAKMLLENPELNLEVSVHTQSIGYDENNLAISQKRAKAIKNYLLYKGVEVMRVTAIGLGETKLVNHCSNGVVCEEEEHLANQRVEVRVR